MPQVNSYPSVASVASADLIIAWRASEADVVVIEAEDLAARLAVLAPVVMEPVEYGSNTVLTDEKLVVGNSAGATTLTLPDATANAGQRIYVANRGAGTLTVQRAGTDTINGDASVDLLQYEGVVFVSLGTGLWATFGAF